MSHFLRLKFSGVLNFVSGLIRKDHSEAGHSVFECNFLGLLGRTIQRLVIQCLNATFCVEELKVLKCSPIISVRAPTFSVVELTFIVEVTTNIQYLSTNIRGLGINIQQSGVGIMSS